MGGYSCSGARVIIRRGNRCEGHNGRITAHDGRGCGGSDSSNRGGAVECVWKILVTVYQVGLGPWKCPGKSKWSVYTRPHRSR